MCLSKFVCTSFLFKCDFQYVIFNNEENPNSLIEKIKVKHIGLRIPMVCKTVLMIPKFSFTQVVSLKGKLRS